MWFDEDELKDIEKVLNSNLDDSRMKELETLLKRAEVDEGLTPAKKKPRSVEEIENEISVLKSLSDPDLLDEGFEILDKLVLSELPPVRKPVRPDIFNRFFNAGKASHMPKPNFKVPENLLFRYIRLNENAITRLVRKEINTHINKPYLEMPHMRKRRKQWKGVPNYRTFEFDVTKSKGYAMRSITRTMPEMTPLVFREVKAKTMRSLSHQYLWREVELTHFETLKSNFEECAWDAYVDLGEKYMQDQMYTDNIKDAWETYMSPSFLHRILKETFEPTLKCFSSLESALKGEIAKEWDRYSNEARTALEERYDMHLSREDIDNLPPADLSILYE